MSKHKPGPFPLSLHETGAGYVILTNQRNHWASTHDPHAARLTLAAPEMLDALETIAKDHKKGWTSEDAVKWFQLVHAAIAKARCE